MPFKFKVLSIDGGGIRGIIPAIILAEIEKRTQKPISKMFDLIAGSSTGGILALALTKPHPYKDRQPHYDALDLIDLYRQEGKRIFKESSIGKAFSVDELFRAKFPSDGREAVLQEYLGNTRIENALREVLIPSYDTELRTPVFFTSNKDKEKTSGRNFRKICRGITMTQAGMATSAAPTYFEPYKVPTVHETNSGFYSLIDGGVFANNPTSLAIMEAIIASKQKVKNLKQPEKQLYLEDILVVSLGTGSLTRPYLYEQVRKWGQLQWALPIINIVFDGQSEAVGTQLDQLLPYADDEPKQYYRFQALLNEANDDIDDPTPENIKKLEELAKLIVDERTDDLDALCKQLQETPIDDETEDKDNKHLQLYSARV